VPRRRRLLGVVGFGLGLLIVELALALALALVLGGRVLGVLRQLVLGGLVRGGLVGSRLLLLGSLLLLEGLLVDLDDLAVADLPAPALDVLLAQQHVNHGAAAEVLELQPGPAALCPP
jgi:hypothetical protein